MKRLAGHVRHCRARPRDPDTIVPARAGPPVDPRPRRQRQPPCHRRRRPGRATPATSPACTTTRSRCSTPGIITITHLDGNPGRAPVHVDWDISAAEKQGYHHFMLKEIHEQPRPVRDPARPPVESDARPLDRVETAAARCEARPTRSIFIACGTSMHAGMVAKYAIEHWARLPVEVEIASEFRYRDPILPPTRSSWRSASPGRPPTPSPPRPRPSTGAKVVRSPTSSAPGLARVADAVLYPGPARRSLSPATKAFTIQSSCARCLPCTWPSCGEGRLTARRAPRRMEALPGQIEQVWELRRGHRSALAEESAAGGNFLFMGRQSCPSPWRAR